MDTVLFEETRSYWYWNLMSEDRWMGSMANSLSEILKVQGT